MSWKLLFGLLVLTLVVLSWMFWHAPTNLSLIAFVETAVTTPDKEFSTIHVEPRRDLEAVQFWQNTSLELDHQDSILILIASQDFMQPTPVLQGMTRTALNRLKKNIHWTKVEGNLEILIYENVTEELLYIYIGSPTKIEREARLFADLTRKHYFNYYLQEWPHLGQTLCLDLESTTNLEYRTEKTLLFPLAYPSEEDGYALLREEDSYAQDEETLLEHVEYQHFTRARLDSIFLIEQNKTTLEEDVVGAWLR